MHFVSVCFLLGHMRLESHWWQVSLRGIRATRAKPCLAAIPLPIGLDGSQWTAEQWQSAVRRIVWKDMGDEGLSG